MALFGEGDFSFCNGKDPAGPVGLTDDATRDVKHSIKKKHLIALTGKFHAFNTRNNVCQSAGAILAGPIGAVASPASHTAAPTLSIASGQRTKEA